MGSETRARLALAALLFATLVSFTALFAGDAFFGPALLGAVLATVIATGGRRLGAGTPLIIAVSSAALFWYLAIVFEGRHLFYGLPTARAASGLAGALASGRASSMVDFAPVPVRPGYVILVVVGMWVAATLAELATFRWRRPLLASAGPTALVSVVLVTGSTNGATFLVLLFLTTLLTFWGLESSHRLRSWGRWVTPWQHHSEEPESLTGSLARKMGASCLAAAVVAPLLLPALNEGLLAWRTGIGPGSGLGGGRRVDLLVSLAPTLVNRSEEELFRVTADRPTYWRLTSLADFDGQDWIPDEENYQSVPLGVVPRYADPTPGRVNMTQRFHITGLGDELLPAASDPTFVRFDQGEDRTADDLAVDPETVELRVADGLAEGLDYEVRSDVPDASFRDLKRAEVGDPGPIFKELPQNTSEQVFTLAERWTEGAKTPFEQLVAIQDHLREFRYTLDVKAEDSSDYLTEFLTETKAGYCQQFATAFAMLARAQGFPARVSVGFLPGSPAPDGRVLVVTGNHAHAWPEVYFEDFGWVPFEPTPRSDATEPSYTVAGFSVGGNAAVRGPTDRGPGGRGIANNLCVGVDCASDGAPRGAALVRNSQPTAGAGARAEDLAWIKTFDRIARVTLVGLILFLIAMPVLKELRVRRRYRAARDPSARTRAAFMQFLSDAAELATSCRTAESPTAFARRLVAANRVPRRAAGGLAALYEAAEYGPGVMTERQAEDARRLAGQLRGALWSSASWWQRAVRVFSPAGLIPSASSRRSIQPLRRVTALAGSVVGR